VPLLLLYLIPEDQIFAKKSHCWYWFPSRHGRRHNVC
jgi:hypothetical protein